VTGPDDPIADLARRIHAEDAPRGVLYVTGGGTELFPMLLARGGGSRTLLAARIPYDANDFRAILGFDPGPIADARAARALAMSAFRHALAIRGDLSPGSVFGLGATSKLARGPGERAGRSHEVHAALQTGSATLSRSVALPPGSDRPWEERINALLLLDLVARAKGVEPGLRFEADGRELPGSALVDELGDASTCGVPDLPAVLEGRSPRVVRALGEGGAIEGDEPTRLLLPGSFRPFHDGHRRMAAVAEGLVGARCDFELSIFHPEKPPLDYLAIADRLAGFAGVVGRLHLTDAPTYLEKARLFPGCTFVVGQDTALRIIDPKYYGGLEGRDVMLAELEALASRLLIFGRVDASGRFRDLDGEGTRDPTVRRFLDRCTRSVPEGLFRVDLSSTQIREQRGVESP